MYGWQKARVIDVRQGAVDIRVLRVVPEQPWPHLAGQNYELREINGPDARMFSILSPSDRSNELEFAVQLIKDGLVSPGLYGLQEGDDILIRGPHGLLFVWHPAPGPLVLIAGGSGIAPLIPIYEQHRRLYPDQPCIFIVSAKTPGHILDYEQRKDILITRFTDAEPRIDQAFITEKTGAMAFLPGTRCFVCGPALDFIENISRYLGMAGFSARSIKTERYY